jgi:hypothetical protein
MHRGQPPPPSARAPDAPGDASEDGAFADQQDEPPQSAHAEAATSSEPDREAVRNRRQAVADCRVQAAAVSVRLRAGLPAGCSGM